LNTHRDLHRDLLLEYAILINKIRPLLRGLTQKWLLLLLLIHPRMLLYHQNVLIHIKNT